MRQQLRALGPLLPLARSAPVVRVQIEGAEAFADSGVLLSSAGLQLVAAASSSPSLATNLLAGVVNSFESYILRAAATMSADMTVGRPPLRPAPGRREGFFRRSK